MSIFFSLPTPGRFLGVAMTLASQRIGARLSEARQNAGLSVRALAAQVGVGHTTISYIEQERHEPSVVLVERLALALRLDPAWLAFGIAHDTPGEGMSKDPIVDLFASIRQHQAQGVKAVHKPLLLLLMLGRLRRKEARLARFEDVEVPLRALLKQFGQGAPHPEYPFWHMRNEPLWEMQGEDLVKTAATSPGAAQLRQAGIQGGFKESVSRELNENAALREQVIEILLNGNFSADQHAQLRQASGLSG